MNKDFKLEDIDNNIWNICAIICKGLDEKELEELFKNVIEYTEKRERLEGMMNEISGEENSVDDIINICNASINKVKDNFNKKGEDKVEPVSLLYIDNPDDLLTEISDLYDALRDNSLLIHKEGGFLSVRESNV